MNTSNQATTQATAQTRYNQRLNIALKFHTEDMERYDYICPQCQAINNMHKDGYQMNDIVETVFCSIECSYQFNLDFKAEFIKEGYTLQDLSDLA